MEPVLCRKQNTLLCAIFAIFTPYESVFGVGGRSEFFSVSQGNQFCGKIT